MEGDFPPDALARLVAPHVESFNYFLSEGLQRVQEALPPLELVHPGDGTPLSVWIEGLRVGKPLREENRSTEGMRELRLMPRECRQAGSSYTAPLTARVNWRVGDGDVQTKEMRLCHFPVMVRAASQRAAAQAPRETDTSRCGGQVGSLSCNLHGLDRAQLLERGEEAAEVGGYFIVNGNEKLVRLLVNQRRHYIMGMVRSAYGRRGKSYSEFATAIRCVAPDETSASVRVHYLTTGSARLAFVLRKQEFFVPVRLYRGGEAPGRVLTPDGPARRWASSCVPWSNAAKRRSSTRCASIAPAPRVTRPAINPAACLSKHQITAGDETASFAAERVEIMLQEGARLDLRTRAQCLAHLGKHFRPVRGGNTHSCLSSRHVRASHPGRACVTGAGRFPGTVRRGCRRATPPRRHLCAPHLETRQAEPAGAHAAQAVRPGASLCPRHVQEGGRGRACLSFS